MTVSTDQYRQRVGLFNAKTPNVSTKKTEHDPISILLGLIILLVSMFHNLSPRYINLFQFYYQHLLPNADNIIVKIINTFAKIFNKKPFVEPQFTANPIHIPEIVLLTCIPFTPTCNDPLELAILTLIVLVCTPILVSWFVSGINILKVLHSFISCRRHAPCPYTKTKQKVLS